MNTDTLEVNERKYPVKIFYEHRHSSRVYIGRQGVTIRIPSFLDREERFRELMEMKKWVRKKLEDYPEKFEPEPQKEYKDDDILKVGNEEYKLKIGFRDKQSSSGLIAGDNIYLVISSNLSKEIQNNHISTLLSRCIAGKRLPKLKVKIDELNGKYFNQKINKIFFKHNKSNWGSCSRRGNINISTRLLFAPDDVLEYVCIHELAHLVERNHSDNFWALVGRAIPNYKEKQQWLKDNGGLCRF